MTNLQPSLFPRFKKKLALSKPVNVSSVPQRSPFRYPGGKTWFVPTFRKWLYSLSYRPSLLVEPFTGGGIISLTALFENLVDEVVMIELDEDIAAVWEAIIEGHVMWLSNRILTFDLSRESVVSELSRQPADTKEMAFQTILKNRTLHGGILAKGSGFIKNGENGKGIKSRWYPQTIAKRLRKIDLFRDRINFKKTGGLEELESFSSRDDVIYFIDPPYTAGGKRAGRRLYKYNKLDHDKLFSTCADLKGPFVMTYDSAPEVKDLACKHGFQTRLIAMNNTHHAKLKELIISKDLSWLA